MRVTTRSMTNSYLADLNKNLESMQKIQMQMSNQQVVSKPSDDPLIAAKTMAIKTSIAKNEQYAKNIEDGIGWEDATDSAISSIIELLQRVKELTVSATNGTKTTEDMNTIAAEIEQRISEFVDLANTTYCGKYIFGGQNTTDKPFSVDSSNTIQKNPNSDDGDIVRQISSNVTIAINITASDIYGEDTATAESIATTLKKVYDYMVSNNKDGLSNDSSVQIDEQIERMLALQAEVGAKENRLNSAKEKNDDQYVNLNDLLSQTNDVDIAEMSIRFSSLQAVYEASLSVGANILQNTLLDYLD